MNSESKKTDFKLVAILLIFSLLMQILMPIVIPLKSFAANGSNSFTTEEETDGIYNDQYVRATVTMSSPVPKLEKGKTVPVTVEIEGDSIVGLSLYLDYDKKVFKQLSETDIINFYKTDTNEWKVLSDSWKQEDVDSDGKMEQAFTVSDKNNQVESNKFRAFTINLTVNDNIVLESGETEADVLKETTLKFKGMSVSNKTANGDYTDAKADWSGYSIDLTLPAQSDSYDITYNANTTDTVSGMP